MIAIEIIKEWIRNIAYVVKSNLRNYARILEMASPYLMYFIGQHVFEERDKFVVGGEIFIPIALYIFIHFIRCYANKIGKGTTIPIPHKRFTQIDDNDEVSVKQDELQELILYIADLEDWLERKGLLK